MSAGTSRPAVAGDRTGALIAELPDGSRLPRTLLEELSCNAKLTGVVYGRKGKPIWRAEDGVLCGTT